MSLGKRIAETRTGLDNLVSEFDVPVFGYDGGLKNVFRSIPYALLATGLVMGFVLMVNQVGCGPK